MVYLTMRAESYAGSRHDVDGETVFVCSGCSLPFHFSTGSPTNVVNVVGIQCQVCGGRYRQSPSDTSAFYWCRESGTDAMSRAIAGAQWAKTLDAP